jgi:hypothetical protein
MSRSTEIALIGIFRAISKLDRSSLRLGQLSCGMSIFTFDFIRTATLILFKPLIEGLAANLCCLSQFLIGNTRSDFSFVFYKSLNFIGFVEEL